MHLFYIFKEKKIINNKCFFLNCVYVIKNAHQKYVLKCFFFIFFYYFSEQMFNIFLFFFFFSETKPTCMSAKLKSQAI